jgi:DnaJ-class molecular chaperone
MSEPCEVCHGTGQHCYFKGESRFVLTWFECPACGGTGLKTAPPRPEDDNAIQSQAGGEDAKADEETPRR